MCPAFSLIGLPKEVGTLEVGGGVSTEVVRERDMPALRPAGIEDSGNGQYSSAVRLVMP